MVLSEHPKTLSLEFALEPVDSHFCPLIVPLEHRNRDPPLVKHIFSERLFSNLTLAKHRRADHVTHRWVQIVDYKRLLLFLKFFEKHMLTQVFQNILHLTHFLTRDIRGHGSAFFELAAPEIKDT